MVNEEYENVEYLSEDIPTNELIGRTKQEHPRLVENLFVNKKKTFKQKLQFWKSFNSLAINPEVKSPFLFLMKNDGYTSIVDNVKVGSVYIIKDEVTKREKGILLSQKKLTTLDIEPYPKCWMAYEDEMSPYPSDVVFDSSELVSIIRKVESNKGILDEKAKQLNAITKLILGAGALILLGLYFAFQQGWFSGL